MNYFSHHFLLPVNDDAYLSLGSILPDMLRNAKSELASMYINENADQPFRSLDYGIQSHIHVDQRFHNSQFFLTYTKRIAKSIRENQRLSMNRYTQFFSHILLELLIDHHLIVDNEERVLQFYNLLHSVEYDVIEAYFNHKFPSQDVELFWETFRSFQNRQFLMDYTALDKVIQFSFYVYEKTTKQHIDRGELIEYRSMIDNKVLPIIRQEAATLFDLLSVQPVMEKGN